MKVFIYCYNRPDYLEYQIACLKKFIEEDLEIFCIDNSKELNMDLNFKNICSKNKINYVKNLKPNHSLEGTSHYAAMQWSWNEIISKTNEVIVMLDHDNFPIKNISIKNILNNYDIAGIPQGRGHVEYLNPCLMIFNTETIPNKNTLSFNGSRIEGYDTDIGGELYFYFKENPNIKLNKIKYGPIENNDPLILKYLDKYNYPHTFDLISDSFMHPRNGSNWARLDQNVFKNRDGLIFSILKDLL